jgi:hypothetical protein
MTDKSPVLIQQSPMTTQPHQQHQPTLQSSSSNPSIHLESPEIGEDAREDSSGRERDDTSHSNSNVEDLDFLSAYTIPTTLRVAILCRHWNGFGGSCSRRDTCNFKHCTQFSPKESCRNWVTTGACQYGQNCNYFHPIEKPYTPRSEEGSSISSPRPLANPLPGKKKLGGSMGDSNSVRDSQHSNNASSREDLLAGQSGGRWSHNRDSSRSTTHSSSHTSKEELKWGRGGRVEKQREPTEREREREREERETSRSHSRRDSLQIDSESSAEDTASRRDSVYLGGGTSSRPGSTSSSLSRDTTTPYNNLFNITINNSFHNSALNNNNSTSQSTSHPINATSPRNSPLNLNSHSSSSETNNVTIRSQHSKSNSTNLSTHSTSGGGSNEKGSKPGHATVSSLGRESNNNANSSGSNIFRPNANKSNAGGNRANNKCNNSPRSNNPNWDNQAMPPDPVRKTISNNPLYKKKQNVGKPLVLGGDGR